VLDFDGHDECWLRCEKQHTMEVIQVVLDNKLLKAANEAAKREKVNRSALIRQALEEHLKRLHVRVLEKRDQRGYSAKPQREDDYRPLEDAAAWPED
jgi:hypothetical protein